MHPSNVTIHPRRFAAHLPLVAALALNPWGIGFILVVLSGIAAVFSIHYCLSLLILVVPFCAYYLERNMLDRVLLPPFSILAFWEAMSTGIGVALIIYGNEGLFDPSLLKVQIASLIMFPVGFCFYRIGFGRIHKMHFPEQRGAFERDVVRPLVWVGWFFLCYQLVRTFVMAKTGSLDRGDYGHVAMEADLFGIWTYFNVFPRFNNFGFFLAPLVWRCSPFFGRILMIGVVGAYFLIVLVSGSRGILFFPIIYIGIGLYFFRALRSVKLDVLGIVLACALLPLIVFIDAYRNTDAYRATKTTDIIGRLGAFDDALIRMKQQSEDSGGREGIRTLGASLLGRSDYMIYEVVDQGVSHVGFQGFNAIPYTFAPSFLFRNKPILIDSNIIYWNYIGEIDKVGRGMGLAADSYRRFGWFGVPAFAAFFFWLYGLICGHCYKRFFYKDALWGTLLILLSFSFFQISPFSSVLETWWHMSYSVVKHVIGLYVGFWLLKKILNVRGKGGLYQYISKG